MYCDNCGQELREGAKFCPKCGARFSDRNEYTAHMDREVQENDSDSIQNQTENSVSKGKDNKKPKWILYLIIAICAVAALFAAVMFFLTMNSGMTPQKAYKKYYKVLENDKRKVVEFEKEKGANGVAITDINNTGIPDVLYITNNSEDGTDKLYLHSLMDNEKDIEIDMDEELSGSIGESNTIFRIREDSAIYLRNEYGLSRITYSIDDSGTRVILTEILAKRTLDEESGEYVYMILTDSEYLESVSEKEYNKYIDDICSQDVTIIITTLSDEELNKVFPTVDDSIADSCDDAIYKLKNNDITLVGADITEPSDEVASKADQTEAPKEKVGDFVKDDSLVAFDDVLYYVDENGLWKKEHDSDAELLYECSAFNLTTNGQVIYYGVYNETVDYQYYSQTIPTYQYDMYRYDLNNGTNEKLTSFIEAGRPICAVGDIVYYTDYSDDFDGNRAGLSMGLRSYNMSTGEKNYIVDGAHLTAYGNGKIFYRQIMAAGGGFGVHQIHIVGIVAVEKAAAAVAVVDKNGGGPGVIGFVLPDDLTGVAVQAGKNAVVVLVGLCDGHIDIAFQITLAEGDGGLDAAGNAFFSMAVIFFLPDDLAVLRVHLEQRHVRRGPAAPSEMERGAYIDIRVAVFDRQHRRAV